MHQLITIGDPVLDTLVTLSDDTAKLRVNPAGDLELCFSYGAKLPIVDSFQALGGNAANVAVGGRKLGLSTAIITTLGKDDLAMMVTDLLKKNGVDTAYITHDAKAKTRYSIVLNFQADRTILSHASPRTYVWPEKFDGVDWLYYTGLSIGYEAMQEKIVDYLEKHQSVRLAFNPGCKMLMNGLAEVREILSRTDVLLVNLEEAEMLAKLTLSESKSVEAIMHKLLALGVTEVALTDGANGAWAGNQEAIWHLDSFPIPVVSKVGAGDAFSSGYLAARLAEHDLAHALQWGVANSSGVIQGHGSEVGLLDPAGIAKMLDAHAGIKPQKLF